MILHEIELYSTNPEEDKSIYQDILGLKLKVNNPGLRVNNPGLSVYDPGLNGLDLNISVHNPQKKISLSFLVQDVNIYYEKIKVKGIQVSEPSDSHLGLREIKLQDKQGLQIIIHSPTDKSPDWIKERLHQCPLC
jgi:catechol 2,3-dioxygenase-like lactoylglutathione lyase family enzyme